MSKPIIMWEKWRDPYGNDDTSEIQKAMNDIIQNSTDINEDVEEMNISVNDFSLLKSKIPMMMTPMGLIPYTENTACGKIFNFWMGHSNFNITQKISNKIEDIDGVETLDIFTRYRFRIGIGKAFKDSEVMHNINMEVYSLID